MMEKQLKQLPALDGLRVLATLAIFLYHAGILLQGTFPVAWFFMLSGFMMYYTKHTLSGYPNFKAWLGYVKNKLKEFYPLHLVTFVYAFFLTGAHLDLQSIKHAVANLTLLHVFLGDAYVYDYNGLSWFLAATIFLYLVGYFLIRLLNRFRRYRTTMMVLTVVLICLLNGLQYLDFPVYLYPNPFYRILDFFLGMLVADAFIHRKESHGNANMAEIMICAVFLLQYVLSLFLAPKQEYYTILFAVALYVFAKGEGIISQILSADIFRKAAGYSFTFYMIHELVLRTFRVFIPVETMNYYIRLFLIAAASFAVTCILVIPAKKLNVSVNANIKVSHLAAKRS